LEVKLLCVPKKKKKKKKKKKNSDPRTSNFNALDLELDMKIWLTAASGCEYHKMTD
jgi:hypothetical protein